MPEQRSTRRLAALRGAAARPETVRPELELAGWNRRGEFLYSRRLEFPGQAPRVPPAVFDGEVEGLGDLLFFDTETTGLSGGAGTLVFLVGTAWCEGTDLEVEQLFLSDFPGEPEFLDAVKGRFADRRAFVSFNGRAFDSPLLRGRFSLARIPFEIGLQIDLLAPARRLWRGLTGDCSLKTLEEKVLGVTRGIDIPGAEIPEVYFQFLRTGRPGMLPVVFDHNLTDVTSLARMWDALGGLLAGDVAAAPFDGLALGRELLARGDLRGIDLLAEAFRRGDAQAGLHLGLHHKRGGAWDEAVAVWERLVAETRSLAAAVELAKYLEHRRRDPFAALERVEVALSWSLPLSVRTRSELAKRRRRLERKVQRGRDSRPNG
jgi:uncharacterized protein YprB with RNaseH-like and TPR domain